MASLKESYSDEVDITATEWSLLVAWIILALIVALAVIGAAYNAVIGNLPCSA